MTACTEDPIVPAEPPAQEEAKILIETTSIVMPEEGGTKNVEFSTTQDWKAEIKHHKGNSWCTSTPTSGTSGDA